MGSLISLANIRATASALAAPRPKESRTVALNAFSAVTTPLSGAKTTHSSSNERQQSDGTAS